MEENGALSFETIPAPQQPAKSLIVMLHGIGQNANDIRPAAAFMQAAMPHADIIMPLGPEKHFDRKNPERKDGRAWMSFDKKGLRGTWELVKIYAKIQTNRLGVLDDINCTIGDELKKRGLTGKNLALFGFSMGGAMAILSGLSRKEETAAVVSHSGMYYKYPWIQSRPPLQLIMGENDKFYDAGTNLEKFADTYRKSSSGFRRHLSRYHSLTKERLASEGVEFEERVIAGLAHEFNHESLAVAAAFMKARLFVKTELPQMPDVQLFRYDAR